MSRLARIAKPTSSAHPTHDCLYRLAFIGGPCDGYQTQSGELPHGHLQLRSGPADCGTKAGPAVSPRLAHYRLSTTKIVLSRQSPVVLCRFQYCGTAMTPPTESWRRRVFNFVRRLYTSQSNMPSPRLTQRSTVHVQS
jgi:hypothetical protein